MALSPVELAVAFSTGLVASAFTLSGAAKLGQWAKTLEAMTALHVPHRFRQHWLSHALPASELLLSAALILAPGPWRSLVGAGSAVMLGIFTILLVGVLRRHEDVECSCFGTWTIDNKISAWSVSRNVLLFLAALTIALFTAESPSFVNEVLSASTTAQLALVTAWALTVTLMLIREVTVLRRRLAAHVTGAASTPPRSTSIEHPPTVSVGDPLPNVELVSREGITVTAERLGRGMPVLLLFLTAECGSCATVSARVPEWQQRIAPLKIRVATSSRPDRISEQLPEVGDRARYGSHAARLAFGVARSPAAVVLGGRTQPVVASPVVYGLDAIEALVNGIVEARARI